MNRLPLQISVSLVLTAAVAIPLRSEPGSAGTAVQKIDFGRDIKPILSNACFTCHGPDSKTRKGDLRLDSALDSVKAGKSGDRAIVPGKPEQSELVRRIASKDKSEVMPPPGSNKSLSPAERELLTRWVKEGAEYRGHWSFEKPTVKSHPAGQTHSVDSFIKAELALKNLKPAPTADRPTLIRRVSLDLRGFSPSLAEVDEFLKDQRPNAYELMVDRMLASPHFGEKMAQIWLDLARFGDTSGYHYDSTRQMWLWRDYVINSFNANKPFDRFTIEQLAGDLLPDAGPEQKIASGFNRNTRFNEEGGADPEEFVIRYNVDRVNTLGQTWLGLTLGCAECHSHKYDPITQKEYYQLFAFFAGIREPMASGNHGQSLPPLLKMPTSDQEQTLKSDRAMRAATMQKIVAALAAVKYEEPKAQSPTVAPQPKDIVWIDDTGPKGANLQGDGATKWQWVAEPVHLGKKSLKRTGAGLNQDYFTGAADPLTVVAASDRLFAFVYLDPKSPPASIMLQWNDGTWEHRAYWGEDKCFLSGSPDGPNHRKIGPLPKAGEWVRLEVTPEQVGLKPGAKINGWAFTQFGGTVYWDHAGIRTTAPDERYRTSLVEWEKRAKSDNKLPADVQAALKVDSAKRTDAHRKSILDHYVRFVFAASRSTFDPLNEEVETLDARIKQTEDAVPTTMISEEMEKPRDTFVLIRGDFLQKGEKVTRGIPAMFPPMPKDAPLNRLGLAQWMVRPDHPLTSRVAVNRLWAQMFGTGLVRSMGDFGTQGELPSHPELLDWLAIEFVKSGWDVKAMLKRLALSETYRRTSVVDSRSAEVDPTNRFLARAPRYRLSAEEIRDNALAISGLMNNRIGGPSVMPYQPSDFYKGKNEGWPWKSAVGSDQYRRGIYTFWRRTSLHPMFALFDAPSREECSAVRPRTNTPLQALVTLNDPTFVEAARVFAQKLLTQGPADVDGRIHYLFRSAVTREATPAELNVVRRRYQSLVEKYRKDGKAAESVVAVGQAPRAMGIDPAEHAAWAGVAGMLLNLDESLTRE